MLVKHASAPSSVLEAVQVSVEHPSLLRTAHRVTFEYTPRRGYVYIRSRAISSRTNDNFDTFPADELRKSWHTFIGKPVFVNHHNNDHTRMRGVVIDAALHEDTAPDGTDDTWVEVLMEIDAKRFPKLAAALIKREIERTSMGCDVVTSECSYCGNVASTPDDYCVHVQRMKGQRLRRKNPDGTIEDVLVHEICRGISFFENSLLVEDPADPTAYTFGLDVRGVLDEGDEIATLASSAKTAKDERFDGVALKQDDDGWYVTTHRARSDSYPTPDDIPADTIAFIESTGAKMNSKTARGLEPYGPDAPSPDVGTRWEGPATTAYGFSVSVHWRGDETMLLSGVFDSYERAVEWAELAGAHPASISVALRDNVSKAYIPRSQWHTASKTASEYPQKRSPDRVETLRMQECPVCGSDAAWNPDGRCDVCGYLPPPRPFQEPDTDVAGRADRSGGWFDPDLTVAPPFKPGDYDRPGEDASDPVRQPLSATKGQRPTRQGDQHMAQPKSVAAVARQRVAAANAPKSAARSNQDLLAENERLRERIARLTRVADADNPAQPVSEPAAQGPAESGQETMNEPEAQNVDVTTPGGVLADPQSAPADVTSVGGEIADPIVEGSNQTVDVEAPVAGTTEVDPNASEQTLPNVDAETMGDPAFAGDWLNPGADSVPNIGGNAAGAPEMQAESARRSERARISKLVNASRDRIWASIRLARLQMDSGIASGDLVDVARQIEASAQSIEAINAQVSTLHAVAAQRPRRPQASAPAPGRVANRAPSLAAGSMPVVGGLASRDARDEALFEA